MRADRRRLRSDKLDLVGQMKQLYHTLEDKESELREFIRNYEQRMNEISEQAKKVGYLTDFSLLLGGEGAQLGLC